MRYRQQKKKLYGAAKNSFSKKCVKAAARTRQGEAASLRSTMKGQSRAALVKRHSAGCGVVVTILSSCAIKRLF